MGLRGLNCCAVFFGMLGDNNDLLSVFNRVRPTYSNGVPKIFFSVLICISGLFSKEDANVDTVIFQRNCNYNVLIRLKHTSSGKGFDMDSFSFSTHEPNENNYFNFQRIIEDVNIKLPYGIGDYSVSIFIKKEEESTWFKQSEQHFLITNDF